MQKNDSPIVKDLVLIGAGHAHLAVLRRFAMHPVPGLRLTLINPTVYATYSGCLPGYLAGHYSRDESRIDLVPLTQYANARLYLDTITDLDPTAGILHTCHRPAIRYDLLSINTGSTPHLTGITGDIKRVIPIKPLDHFITRWSQILIHLQTRTRPYHLAVVGGGAGSVELVLALQYRIQQELKQTHAQLVHYHLFTRDATLLNQYPTTLQQRLTQLLEARGIQCHTNARVTQIDTDTLTTADGTAYPADAVLWATHASAPDWPRLAGLDTDANGFIQVHDTLQSVSHPNLFAAGDIAAPATLCPKSGVYAVRQGPILADNLRRIATGRTLRRYRRQRNHLSLISTGNQYALATRGNWVIGGTWLWHLKNQIDQRFLQRYNQLPARHAPAPPKLATGMQLDTQTATELQHLPLRCGGCGAKVGSTVLNRVLQRLPTASHPDLTSSGQTEDAAILSVPAGHKMVQSVDYFRAFIDDPYRFGAIATNHALGDLYAMGARPQSALAIATLPYAREAITEQTLYELMLGATEVLQANSAVLAGGHTSEGAELAFGLTVNGTALPDQLWPKSGMQPGDALILNKPLGTGTLLAAAMRGQARGDWIETAIMQMMQSQQNAVDILRQHGTRACTDITGFGLLGHLLEMMQAAACDAHIRLDQLPILDGVPDTLAAGIVSSLQPANLRARRAIRNLSDELTHHPLYPVLFDPQTAGGLLAAVPADQAAGCVTALQHNGYPHTCIIGHADHQATSTPEIMLTVSTT